MGENTLGGGGGGGVSVNFGSFMTCV